MVDFAKAIEQVKAEPKKKFVQSIDMSINFTGMDFNKPENRIDLEVVLPKGRGKPVRVGVIAADELIPEAKKAGDIIVSKEELEAVGKDRKKAKKIANDCEFFLCQTDLMATVGRYLGPVLGPRGKMPKPVPGSAKIAPLIERLRNTVRVKTKGKFLPVVHTTIGTEDMDNAALVDNANAVFNAVRDKLPGKESNIKSVYIKTTMGKAVKA